MKKIHQQIKEKRAFLLLGLGMFFVAASSLDMRAQTNVDMRTLGSTDAFGTGWSWNATTKTLLIGNLANVNITSGGFILNNGEHIVVNAPDSAKIIITNLVIHSAESPITIGASSVAIITALQTNHLFANSSGHAGIYVPPGSNLIVRGKGYIEAKGDVNGNGGAGIGGHGIATEKDFGNITITDSVTVSASGSLYAAGIGSGGGDNAAGDDVHGNIIITEKATVSGYGGTDAAGIGAGNRTRMTGTITIAGGIVTANGGNAGLGEAAIFNSPNMRISINGHTIVHTNNSRTLAAPALTSKLKGIVFMGSDTGWVYGNVAMNQEVEFITGKTVIVAGSTSLTIPANVVLKNHGKIIPLDNSMVNMNSATFIRPNKIHGANVLFVPTIHVAANSISYTAASLKAYTGQSVEYAISTSSIVPTIGWSSSLTQTGLSNGATYYIFARSKEDNNFYTGDAILYGPVQAQGLFIPDSSHFIIDPGPVIYDANGHRPFIRPISSAIRGGIGDITATYYQNTSTETIYTPSTAFPKDVGVYKVFVDVSEVPGLSEGVSKLMVGTYTITKASLIVQVEENYSREYGDSDPVSFSYIVIGLKGDDTPTSVFTGKIERFPGENVGNYSFRPGTLAPNRNYTFVFVPAATFSITPAPLTIVPNLGQTKVYGDPDPPLTYVAAGFKRSDGVSNTITGVLSRTAGENVSSNYTIIRGTIAAGSNYTIDFVTDRPFVITRALLTLTPNSGQSKTYGAADPVFTFAASGFKNNDADNVLRGSLSRTAGENTGAYPIVAGTISAVNYTITVTAGVNFIISKAMVTIVPTAGQSKHYGESDPIILYSVIGMLNNETISVFSGALSRMPGEDIGTYTITSGTLSAQNYSFNVTMALFEIRGATLVVTPTVGQSKIYGDPDPLLTYTISGLANGDVESAVLSGALSRIAGENVGIYNIVQGTLSAVNYNIVIASATFDITKALLVVTPLSGQGKVYGYTDPTLNFTATGFKNGDDDRVIRGLLGRVVGEDVGSYLILAGRIDATNYNITVVAGVDFTISRAALTIIPDPEQGKIYGHPEPALTYTITGLLHMDSTTVLTGALSRVAGEVVGSYDITIGTITATNYFITLVPRSFIINKGSLVVTPDPGQSKTHGENDPPVTFTAVGFANGEDTSIFSGALSRTFGENVGTYIITQGSLATTNYDITVIDATFAITPKQQIINFMPRQRLCLDNDGYALIATTEDGVRVKFRIDGNSAAASLIDIVLYPVQLGSVTVTAYIDNMNYMAAEVSAIIMIDSACSGGQNGGGQNGGYVTIINALKDETTNIWVVDCGTPNVTIDIIPPNSGATIIYNGVEGNSFTVDVSKPGIYIVVYSVLLSNGVSQSFTLKIESRFSFWSIVEQKFNNTLIVNNNPSTNNGYRFTDYVWYKNETTILGREQYYSAGERNIDRLDQEAYYSVAMRVEDGDWLHTCPGRVVLAKNMLQIYPTIVEHSTMVNIESDAAEGSLILIYDMRGREAGRHTFTGSPMQVAMPEVAGTYIIMINNETEKIIVK